MLTLENVIYLLSNGLRVYTYSKLLRCFYKDSRINPVLNSTIMFLFFITNSAAYLTLNVPLLNLFSNLLFIYSAAFIYGKKVLYNIGIGSLCYALNIFIDCGFYFFVGSSVVIDSGFMTSLGFYGVSLVIEYFFRERRFNKIDGSNLVAIIIIPVSSICIAIFTMSEYNVQMLLIATLLILINVVVFYLFSSLDKAYTRIHEHELVEQQVKAYSNQLNIVYQLQEQQSYFRHDLKNHLQKMSSLLENKKYEELKKYLNRSFDELTVSERYINSGNYEIDSLLNYKLSQLKNTNSEIKSEIFIPDDLNIDSFDINVILGNLADNAIRALKKEKSPSLFICIKYEKNILFISMRNTCSKDVKIVNGMPETHDISGHGIGLKSVEHTVKKYNGNIKVSYKNNLFTVTVMLYT